MARLYVPELARSMGRTPVSENETRPASIIGAIAEVLVDEPQRCEAANLFLK